MAKKKKRMSKTRKSGRSETGERTSQPGSQRDIVMMTLGIPADELMRTPPPQCPGTMEEYLQAHLGMSLSELMTRPDIR